MNYQFRFAPYRRPFKTPLRTHHGLWTMRQGIILSLQDEMGRITQGEIAPLPWFGTETLEEAIAFCAVFGGNITREQIAAIPDTLPACQFGFETAQLNLASTENLVSLPPTKFCQLIRRSPTLFQDLQTLLQQGFRTFKLKIALDTPTTEIALCQQILAALPADGRLRLDANGGLNREQAKYWLNWGESQAKLEFIEQPLAPEHFSDLLQLNAAFQTQIALDESVSQLASLEHCYGQGWCGVFVIKLAIAGFPSRLKEFCQAHQPDIVISTVFETAVGQRALLNFSQKFFPSQRALGMGDIHWFTD
ncbi:o-succinylbenzoate synthase [Picosynechococcus sp. PCC 7003]|uniref:o-succinylbenzoate synthase n=1 Tax=Picosynechococcus sp. PCC 7003 TaxID=374981 RepID=UPI0008104890|nr:o-succinylbenzoate synthase [Picosynechococcus sp. PCC 7003]ANV85271.1 o-succinylbenzoate synthase [Picosynechococcus sp. PCC 7003]